MSNVILCPKCGFSSRADAKFCERCGFNFSKLKKEIVEEEVPPKREESLKSEESSKSYSMYMCPNIDCSNKSVRLSVQSCQECGTKMKGVDDTERKDIINQKDLRKLESSPKVVEKQKTDNKLETFVCPNLNCDYTNFQFSKQNCPKCGIELIPVSDDERKEITYKKETNPEINYDKPLIYNDDSLEVIEEKVAVLDEPLANEIIECKNCGKELSINDTFCFNCGTKVEVAVSEIEKEVPIVEKPVKTPITEEIAEDEHELDLNDLEKLYNKKLGRVDIKFKFAYISFLDKINNNLNMEEFSDYYKNEFDTSIDDLKKNATDDKYLKFNDSTAILKNLEYSELIKILNSENLSESGTREELIARIKDNVSESKIRNLPNGDSYVLTDDAKNFIDENNHILYYLYNENLKSISMEEYDNFFLNNDYSNEEGSIILLEKLEDQYAKDAKWDSYLESLKNQLAIYKEIGDDFRTLNCYLMIFLADINDWTDNNGVNPRRITLESELFDDFASLLTDLSLEFNVLKEKYDIAIHEIQIPGFLVPENEAFKYLIRAFSGENLRELSIEIQSRFQITDEESQNYLNWNGEDPSEIAKKIQAKFK